MNPLGRPLSVPKKRTGRPVLISKKRTDIPRSVSMKGANSGPEQGVNMQGVRSNEKESQKMKTCWRQIGSLMYLVEVVEAEDDLDDLALLVEMGNLLKWGEKGGRLDRTPRRYPVVPAEVSKVEAPGCSGLSPLHANMLPDLNLPYLVSATEAEEAGWSGALLEHGTLDKPLTLPVLNDTATKDQGCSSGALMSEPVKAESIPRTEKKGKKRKVPICEEESNTGGLNLTEEMTTAIAKSKRPQKKPRYIHVPILQEKAGESSGLNRVIVTAKDALKGKLKDQAGSRRKGESFPLARRSGSGSQKEEIKPSFSEPLVEQPEWISVDDAEEKGKADMKKFFGINFYKRINRWTTHIWVPKQEGDKGKQKYIGSFATATEAIRAYDKASIKYFGKDAKLNNQTTDYLRDRNEMDGLTDQNYISGLRKSSKLSKPVYVAPGIVECPAGMFEVKILKQGPRKQWKFLGRFESLANAKRFLQGIMSRRARPCTYSSSTVLGGRQLSSKRI